MKDDRCERFIIRGDGQWLRARNYKVRLVYSTSAYDAWKTKRIEKAKELAKDICGEVWIFNHLTGDVRPWKEEKENEDTRDQT